MAVQEFFFDAIPSSISLFGFADDHSAKNESKPTALEHEKEVIQELETCALTFDKWIKQTKL